MEPFNIFGQIFNQISRIGDAASFIWFIVLPLVLYPLFRRLWIEYIADKYAGTLQFDTIEIIPPRDTEKSPQPMESIFAGLHGTRSTITTHDDVCLGVFPASFSLEIVGIEGVVHFYVVLQHNFRPVFESHFYAQYPGVELRDAEDYTGKVPHILPNKEWESWGADIQFLKPDPIPIKTWPAFEEDITGKMIDPLSGLLETMGRTRKGEHLWLQIIITPEPEGWHQEGLAYADGLKGRDTKPAKNFIGKAVMAMTGFIGGESSSSRDSGEEAPLEFRLSPVERKVLESVEENIGRYMFKAKMRMMYIGRKEIFDKSMVAGFFGSLKQFSDFNLNTFKPNDASATYANYIFRKTRLRLLQRKLFYRYKKRLGSGKKIMLSDRELATIFHMPDVSVVAPAMVRSDMRQSTAPSNLPIEDE